MRKSIIAASALGWAGIVLVSGTPAQAQEHPWCLQLGGTFGHFAMLGGSAGATGERATDAPRLADDSGGGRNCGFDSYEQCMAARIGNGGFCERNLFYRGELDPRGGPAPRPLRRGR